MRMKAIVLVTQAWLVMAAVPAMIAAQGGPGDPSTQDQLDALVAPIALYPDPLVAQILPASTHPLEVAAAAAAVAHGGRPTAAQAAQWDPSVQALVSFPTVLKMMHDKVEWTEQLWEAVATDPSAVMAAIQRDRSAAFRAGNLQSNNQQTVQMQADAQGDSLSTTITIEPANPQVIYVPQYNPTVIMAPPPAYGYAAPALVTFGLGFPAGAATAYACNWGAGSSGGVTVNKTYTYSATNTYAAYHPATMTTYHPPAANTYAAYDSKTGTYGAYNPETGKYATYNPSTGAYNKDGTTGTYDKPSSITTRSGVDTGYDSKTGTYGAYNPDSGKYATYNPSTGAYNRDGTTGTYQKPASTSAEAYDRNEDNYYGAASRGYAFGDAGGGGWGAREASARGARSFGARRVGGYRR